MRSSNGIPYRLTLIVAEIPHSIARLRSAPTSASLRMTKKTVEQRRVDSHLEKIENGAEFSSRVDAHIFKPDDVRRRGLAEPKIDEVLPVRRRGFDVLAPAFAGERRVGRDARVTVRFAIEFGDDRVERIAHENDDPVDPFGERTTGPIEFVRLVNEHGRIHDVFAEKSDANERTVIVDGSSQDAGRLFEKIAHPRITAARKARQGDNRRLASQKRRHNARIVGFRREI